MSSKMTIAIASDLSGFPLKTAVVEYLEGREDVTVMDFGIDDPEKPQPYTAQAPRLLPPFNPARRKKAFSSAAPARVWPSSRTNTRESMPAWRIRVFSGERSKIINNANVLTMGGWITAPFLGVQIVEAWLSMAFAQKMEFKKDFLAENFALVQKLEEKHFK
jgi:ribose 5-phosphate isomerase B